VGFELDSPTLPYSPSTDRAAAWSVLTRVVQAAVGLLTIGLVAIRLDPDVQGYYYTFLALVAFLPLADFGVSYAMMQSASHQARNLRWTPTGLDGEPAALRETGELFIVAQRWNLATTLISILLLCLAGTFVLRKSGEAPHFLLYQWAALLACIAAWQVFAPRIALLEGGGRVEDVWRFRLTQEILAGLVLAAGLLAGLGLSSLAASAASRLLHTAVWLSGDQRSTGKLASNHWHDAITHWRREVWSFQWRIGLSVLSGFLIYQLFSPVLLATQGPTVAGRFGMTIAVTNGLLNATTGWLNSQAPHFGHLVAAKEYEVLDQDFARTFRRSGLLAVGGALVLICGVMIGNSVAPQFATRVLPPLPFALLTTAAVINHVIFAFGIYLRAHRREPLLLPSVIGAVCWASVLIWSARTGSATLVAGAYCGMTFVGLLMGYAIFLVCRRRWHALL
jgi:O-antigen/teichoic acid export membrane protein